MAPRSAGILLHRRRGDVTEVLLVHFGGPFWRNRDVGGWAIPKGHVEPGEEPEAAARREFLEELGAAPPAELAPLATIRQRGGKWVEAFVAEGDFDTAAVVSNEVSIEWPPRSGRFQMYPEVDRAEWFAMAVARVKILPSQVPLLDALERLTGR